MEAKMQKLKALEEKVAAEQIKTKKLIEEMVDEWVILLGQFADTELWYGVMKEWFNIQAAAHPTVFNKQTLFASVVKHYEVQKLDPPPVAWSKLGL